MGSCAITIKSGVIARPRFARNSDSAILRAAIDRGSRKPLCYPSPQLCAPASSSPGEVRVLPPFNFWPYGFGEVSGPELSKAGEFLQTHALAGFVRQRVSPP